MQHTFRLSTVLGTALLSLTGLVSGSYAQGTPESGSAATRAAALTRYYTQHLQLHPHQHRLVYRAALAEVHSFDSLQALGASSPAALAGIKARFGRQLEPVLSAAQRSTLASLPAPSHLAPAPLSVAERH